MHASSFRGLPICVWGCGPWADSTIRDLKSLGVETFIGGDPASEDRQRRIEKLAGRHNISQLNEEDLLGQCRAVVLAMPPKANHERAGAFLHLGLDVYMQKPLILSEAKLLFEYATANGRIIMGGSDMPYRPDIIRARALIAQGIIGEPIYFQGVFCTEMVPTGWRDEIVTDLGEHVVSVVCEVMGTPERMSYDRMSSVSGQFHFRGSDWAADVRVSWQSASGSVPEIAIQGTEATIEVNNGVVQVYKQRPMRHVAKLWRWPRIQHALRVSKTRYMVSTGQHSYANRLERFLTACMMREPNVDFGVDLRNAELLQHVLEGVRHVRICAAGGV